MELVYYYTNALHYLLQSSSYNSIGKSGGHWFDYPNCPHPNPKNEGGWGVRTPKMQNTTYPVWIINLFDVKSLWFRLYNHRPKKINILNELFI